MLLNSRIDIHSYKRRNTTLLSMGYTSYEEYLNSPLWFSIRAVKIKSSTKCYCCNGGDYFTIHHLSYDRETLEGNTLKYLVPLCKSCHYFIEFDRDENKLALPEVNARLEHLRRLLASPTILVKQNLSDSDLKPVQRRKYRYQNTLLKDLDTSLLLEDFPQDYECKTVDEFKNQKSYDSIKKYLLSRDKQCYCCGELNEKRLDLFFQFFTRFQIINSASSFVQLICKKCSKILERQKDHLTRLALANSMREARQSGQRSKPVTRKKLRHPA